VVVVGADLDKRACWKVDAFKSAALFTHVLLLMRHKCNKVERYL
jgi:hypothetical protein